MFKTSLAISPLPAAFGPLLFSGDWKRGLDSACELGYDAVELSLRDPNAKLIVEIVDQIKKNGLFISAIATGQSYYQDRLSLTSLDPQDGTALIDRIKSFVEIAHPGRVL